MIISQTAWGGARGKGCRRKAGLQVVRLYSPQISEGRRTKRRLARSKEAADVRTVSRRPAAPPVLHNIWCLKNLNRRFVCLLPNLARTGLTLWCWGRGCILALRSVPSSNARARTSKLEGMEVSHVMILCVYTRSPAHADVHQVYFLSSPSDTTRRLPAFPTGANTLSQYQLTFDGDTKHKSFQPHRNEERPAHGFIRLAPPFQARNLLTTSEISLGNPERVLRCSLDSLHSVGEQEDRIVVLEGPPNETGFREIS